MLFKRQSEKQPVSSGKLPRSGTDESIARAKERLLARKRQQTGPDNGPKTEPDTRRSHQGLDPGRGGLDVEIHPLLRNIGQTPTIPKNHNPLKQTVKPWFDTAAINPYLNQADQATTSHKPRSLQLNPQGKYIAKGNELREALAQKKLEQQRIDEMESKGLMADENIGEHLYKLVNPPRVEWWDQPYLKTDYAGDKVLDNELAPVTNYIQHPVLTVAPWEAANNQDTENKLYLTKQELKRKRRNERQQRHQDKQDRIKLGLDAPPPPKIKLSNLMNVLTNEAIKDPTGVEMRVKQEVEERKLKHLQQNEDRKLTKEQKHEKIIEKNEKSLKQGIFTTVYKIGPLEDRNLYKVDINAKQLSFFGIILKNPKLNLVVVEGSNKNINFYKKLLTKRMKWEDSWCEIIWEGELLQPHFQKWSIMYSEDDDQALQVLQKFGIENYWRQANV